MTSVYRDIFRPPESEPQASPAHPPVNGRCKRGQNGLHPLANHNGAHCYRCENLIGHLTTEPVYQIFDGSGQVITGWESWIEPIGDTGRPKKCKRPITYVEVI